MDQALLTSPIPLLQPSPRLLLPSAYVIEELLRAVRKPQHPSAKHIHTYTFSHAHRLLQIRVIRTPWRAIHAQQAKAGLVGFFSFSFSFPDVRGFCLLQAARRGWRDTQTTQFSSR